MVKSLIVFLLALEARLIVKKYHPFVIAVTGSVGKTSTKDAIYSVLKGQSRYVRKSEKSLNSEIGLPLTIIGVPNAWHSLFGWLANLRSGLGLILKRQEYPDCLILEVGADHPGDIRRTVKWLHPDISVITKVSQTPVHVEFFRSPEEVFLEKASLAEGVKSGGTVILFADDEKVMSLAEGSRSRGSKVVSYGLNETAEVRGSDYSVTYVDGRPTGFSFKLNINGSALPVSVSGVVGETHQYSLLAAAAVGLVKGIKGETIVELLKSHDLPHGRLNIVPGINGSTIIDDTYNSSPDAAAAALRTLEMIQVGVGRKIAILGDMMELGKYSAGEHHRIGRLSAGIVSRLFTVGQRSRGLADEAVVAGLSTNLVESFDSALEAAEQIRPLIQAGDIVLVKGSQSVRMERIVKALMRDPEQAPQLLVRQEEEWLAKK